MSEKKQISVNRNLPHTYLYFNDIPHYYKNYLFLKGNHMLITNKIISMVASHLNSGTKLFKIKINRAMSV